jgi:hypothetical protein
MKNGTAQTSKRILELQAWVSDPALQALVIDNKHRKADITLYANQQPIGRLDAASPSIDCGSGDKGEARQCTNAQPLLFELFVNQKATSGLSDPQTISSWAASLKAGVNSRAAQSLFSTEQVEEIASHKKPILRNVDFHVRAAVSASASRLHMIFSKITDDWILEFIKTSGIDINASPYRVGFTFGRDGNYRFTVQTENNNQHLRTWHPMSPVMREDVSDIYSALGDKAKTLAFRTPWLTGESAELIFKMEAKAMDRDAWPIWEALLPEDPAMPDTKTGLIDLNKSYTHDGDIFLLAGQQLELKPAIAAFRDKWPAENPNNSNSELLSEVQCFALARTTVRSTPQRLSFWSGGESVASYHITIHGSNFSAINPDELRTRSLSRIELSADRTHAVAQPN